MQAKGKQILRALLVPLIVCLAYSNAAAAPTVTLTNTTRGGSDFLVGDNFQINISGGAPNANITMMRSYNSGGFQGPWSVGTTDGSGNFQVNGTETSDYVGYWVEMWYVDGVQANPTLSFYVLAPTPTGSIDLSPNPCTVYPNQTYCTTTVSWSSENTSSVQIWVSENGGAEVLFASSGAGGTYYAAAPWIMPSHNYDFVLYQYQGGNRVAQLGGRRATATISLICPP
jgi:hypothetical protein